jgi:hypothetical protein
LTASPKEIKFLGHSRFTHTPSALDKGGGGTVILPFPTQEFFIYFTLKGHAMLFYLYSATNIMYFAGISKCFWRKLAGISLFAFSNGFHPQLHGGRWKDGGKDSFHP